MAITAVTYKLLLDHRRDLKHGGSLLEIGEANWYGDLNPAALVDESAPVAEIRELKLLLDQPEPDLFAIAKFAYKRLFAPTWHQAIDFHGTEGSLRHDLNVRLWGRPPPVLFDVLINNGTAEHIFNVAQVFRTMHDACVVGGVMIHDAPCTGWFDHGFYNFHPTLFYDLAAANAYEILGMYFTQFQSHTIIKLDSREAVHALAEVPHPAMLFVMLRKTADKPFVIPLQGVYAEGFSAAGQQAWEQRR